MTSKLAKIAGLIRPVPVPYGTLIRKFTHTNFRFIQHSHSSAYKFSQIVANIIVQTNRVKVFALKVHRRITDHCHGQMTLTIV